MGHISRQLTLFSHLSRNLRDCSASCPGSLSSQTTGKAGQSDSESCTGILPTSEKTTCTHLEDTCALSKNHAAVCIEELRVSNMTRSAKGTVEIPGCNVKAKPGLNKATLDQGWGTQTRQLGDKQSWRGGLLVLVPPQYTSQKCLECRYIDSDNRRSQASGILKMLIPMLQITY